MIRKLLSAAAVAALLFFSPGGGSGGALAQQSAPTKVSESWFPQGRISNISVTNSSAATALPTSGFVAKICNTGTNDAYLAFGAANTVTVSTANGSLLTAGWCWGYDLRAFGNVSLYVAAITASSTTTLYVETGSGTPVTGNAASSGGGTSVTQGTTPWVDNVTQWASVALGAPSNYGTSPGAVAVMGVNAFITNSVAVTGTFWQTTQPVSGTFWQATQPVSGTFWQATQPISIASAQVVSGAFASGAFASGAMVDLVAMQTPVAPGSATATKGILLGCQYNSTPPVFTDGLQGHVQCGPNGGLSVGGTIASGATDSGNPVKIGGPFNTTQPTVTNGQRIDAQFTARGALIVAPGIDNFAVQATLSAETTKVIGTVNQGTSPWVVSNGGTFAVQNTPSLATASGWTPKLLNALTNTAVAVKASAGQLAKLYCYNPNSSVAYVQVFNIASGSVTVGTSTPLQSYAIAPTNTGGFALSGIGDQYGTAISVAATTTATGGSAPSTALDCNVSYN